jgi:hypothetical protein
MRLTYPDGSVLQRAVLAKFQRIVNNRLAAVNNRPSGCLDVRQELLEGTRAEWEFKGVILGHRYENSPVVIADGHPYRRTTTGVYKPTDNRRERPFWAIVTGR